ncbi:MAG: cytochrome c [Sulfurospirillaceae bacterium]|nr:cytochrome c [Sulfurospirillaceae bacterium]
MSKVLTAKTVVAVLALLLASNLSASKMNYKKELAEGAHIFKRCSVCHGLHAQKHALGKSDIIAHYSEKRIERALKNYRAAIEHDSDAMIMNAQAKHMNNKQIHDVALYVKTL